MWPLGCSPAGRSHPAEITARLKMLAAHFHLSVLTLSQEVRAAAEGKGSFVDYEVPGGDGHRVMFSPPLWTGDFDRYLNSIGAEAKR